MRKTRALAPAAQQPWSALQPFPRRPHQQKQRLALQKRRKNRGYQHQLVKSG
jgi:hypothetical protein